MAETQIIFRLDKKILKELDESLKISGFKTRTILVEVAPAVIVAVPFAKV